MSLDTAPPDVLPIAELLDSYGAISRMPEATAAEAMEKRDAYNDAIGLLSQRLSSTHSESGSDVLDDESQEQSEDEREQNLIAFTVREFRKELTRLHEVILRLGS